MRTSAPATGSTSTPTVRTRRRAAATTSPCTAARRQGCRRRGSSGGNVRAARQRHDADRDRRRAGGGGAHARRRDPGVFRRHPRAAAAEERPARGRSALALRQHGHRRPYVSTGPGPRCERVLVGMREGERAPRPRRRAVAERRPDSRARRGAAAAGPHVRGGAREGGARGEERVRSVGGCPEDGSRRVGEVRRRLGAAPARAVHDREIVPLFLVYRADGGSGDPRLAGRRRLLAPRLAAHRAGEDRRGPSRRAGAATMSRGFTLLEVMISLAILAVGLVAISGLNGGAVTMHAYGRRATEASLLLRGKMLDVEDDLQKNGFSDFDDEKHGDFVGDGAPDYAWSAEILKPDVQLDPAQLLNLVGGGGQGQGTQAKAGGVTAGATALAGSLMGTPGGPALPR